MDQEHNAAGGEAPGAGRSGSSDGGDARRAFPAIDPHILKEFEPDETNKRRSRDLDGEREPKPRKRGFWRGVGYLLGGPISAIGMDNVAESASVMGGLAQRIRTGPRADERVRVYDDRTLDLAAMARNRGEHGR